MTPPNATPPAVPSPCTQVCKLNAANICIGCGRTQQEIAAWGRLDAAGQREIKRLAGRRVLATERTAKAFTLIELLVVITIIGILVALLLPAVQAVREAARKASCKSNQHQIGLALHAYHDVHNSLPTGCIEWRAWDAPPSHRQFAWSALLLPFLEQQNLHAQIDWHLPFDAPENKPAAETRVPTYVCPSETSDSLTLGHTTYGGIFGERILNSTPDDGSFLYERSIRFRDISDGLTNTLAAAEDIGGPDKQWINGRNVFVVAHGINDPSAWVGDNEIRSTHPGGAMVLFADGRTVFLSDSTDRELLGSWITRAGSPYRDNYAVVGSGSSYGSPVSLQEWTTGGVTFGNQFTPAWGSWSGWSWSNVQDNATAGFANQYASFPGGGAGPGGLTDPGGRYAIGFGGGYFDLPSGAELESLYFSNTTYVGLAARDGDRQRRLQLRCPSPDPPVAGRLAKVATRRLDGRFAGPVRGPRRVASHRC